MRNEILENTEFSILSRSIDNATKCRVVDVSEDAFSVQLAMQHASLTCVALA